MNETSRLQTVEGQPIPLRGVEVTGQVLGGHAEWCVRQRYQNAEPKPVEAVYIFPLPSDATLTGFSMSCAGRFAEGVVKEREQAFKEYDEALTQGHGAALLDQERANVFTAQVGNLLPGEETFVEVKYVQRVQADEGALRVCIPTLVAPRYVPGASKGDRTSHGWADPTDRVPDADRITPPIGKVSYGLKLDVTLSLGRALEVESPSHAVQISAIEGGVRVRLAQEQVALDRDVVLNVRGVESGPFSTVTAHKAQGASGAFAFTFVPDLFDGRKAPSQKVVFVIDISGSMEGDSIREAKAALRLCLRQLREGDRFGIVAFNSGFHTFHSELVPFTQSTLERADAYAAGLHAEGGTEMLEPLLAAVGMAPDGVVVLLTDGQVGNEDEILSGVLAARKGCRVYSFGIGTNVSDQLLRDLARRTGGAMELIHPGERIDEKVVAQFARAVAPRVEQVSVRFDGLDVGELAPAELPPLVDGEPWTLFGRFERAGRGTVEIRGRLEGEPFLAKVPIELPERAEHPHVLKLWAAERIRDFEAAQLTGRRAETMKQRIVELALEHQLASRYTSFVVVEHRTGDRRATGQPETRVVPVSTPAGWAMFQKPRPTMAPPMAAPAAPPMVTRAGVVKGIAAAASALLGGSRAEGRRAAPGRAKAKATDALYQLESSAELSVPVAAEPLELGHAREEMPAGAPALLSRQLASGLWEGSGGTDEARLEATALALLELLREGVTSAHPMYGAQVKKAIEALLSLAAKMAPTKPELVELALGVAWLLATGKRTRGQIEAVVSSHAALAPLRARLGDAAATRSWVDQLASTLHRPSGG